MISIFRIDTKQELERRLGKIKIPVGRGDVYFNSKSRGPKEL